MALILVTGAHGFIGRHLAKSLALASNCVVGLGHGIWPSQYAERWGISHWHNGEIDGPNLRLIQQRFGTPDLVYHLAGGSSVGIAISNPREDFHRTVGSTIELLEWLRLDAAQSRLVAVSSAAVYGGGHIGPIAETTPTNPFSPYGHHKNIMELLCRSYCDSYGLSVAIARLFSVYGPGLRKQLLWDICSQLALHPGHLILGGSGGELRDWAEVNDVARALGLVGDNIDVAFRIINIGTGHGTNISQIARGIVDAWSAGETLPAEIRFSGETRAGDPQSLVAHSEQLAAIGFEWEIDVPKGLAAYVNWFRSEAREKS